MSIQTLTIAREYAPYNLYQSFEEGFLAYQAGKIHNPYPDGIDAQAWDRGAECAMRVWRWERENVGQN